MKKKRMGRKSLKIKWFRKKITKKDISSSIYKSGIINLSIIIKMRIIPTVKYPK